MISMMMVLLMLSSHSLSLFIYRSLLLFCLLCSPVQLTSLANSPSLIASSINPSHTLSLSLSMPTLFTPMEGDQDHQSDDHSDQHLFNPRSSSLTCTIFFKSSQDQGASTDDDHDQQKIKDEQLLPYQSNMNKNSDIVKHSREEEDRKKPTKWMSSKMRFMRKMMNPHNIIPNRRRRRKTVEFGVDQQTNQDRVCSDCHTTKTPLWRTGPQGPKSLCNACGIRQRKARRVIAVAGTVGLDTGMIPADTWNEVEKQQKRSNVDETLPFKKRCKIISSQDQTDKKKHCFDLSKSSANLHSVLPQDERDAAILLMALSYGLICS